MQINYFNDSIAFKFDTQKILNFLFCKGRKTDGGEKIDNEIYFFDLLQSFCVNNNLISKDEIQNNRPGKILNSISLNSGKGTFKEFLNSYIDNKNFDVLFPIFKNTFKKLGLENDLEFLGIEFDGLEEFGFKTKIKFSYSKASEEFKNLMWAMFEFSELLEFKGKRKEKDQEFFDEFEEIFSNENNKEFLNIYEYLKALPYQTEENGNRNILCKIFFDKYMKNELPKDKFQLFKLLREWGAINNNVKLFNVSIDEILK